MKLSSASSLTLALLLVTQGFLHVSAFRQLPLSQPGAGIPASSPSLGPLPWADFNVLHTTDTHGWLRGHLGHNTPEPNYSGDWGDLYSFVHHLKAEARSREVDLLLVDSGDLHDGMSLHDTRKPLILQQETV
jgi:2',3'-cyclic-nucleotide 2'-phosphodiesterase (5'-nucleotidase family)